MNITVSITLSKTISIEEIYDKDGTLDLNSMEKELSLPNLHFYVTPINNGVPQIEFINYKSLGDWYVDDLEAFEE